MEIITIIAVILFFAGFMRMDANITKIREILEKQEQNRKK